MPTPRRQNTWDCSTLLHVAPHRIHKTSTLRTFTATVSTKHTRDSVTAGRCQDACSWNTRYAQETRTPRALWRKSAEHNHTNQERADEAWSGKLCAHQPTWRRGAVWKQHGVILAKEDGQNR